MVYFRDNRHDDRLIGIYRELPALRLTPQQAARLMGVPLAVIEPALRRLDAYGRLRRTADGHYVAVEPSGRHAAVQGEAK